MATPRAAACRSEAAIPARAGIGLRLPHHEAFRGHRPAIGWVEVHSENYLSGSAFADLAAIRADYPVSLHSVGLSLGSATGLDPRHLARLADLARRIEPGLISEHLAWGAVDHAFLADLLPLPLTEESLALVSDNVGRAQDVLGRRLLIENPATYLQFRHSTIPEPEFLVALVARTGCGLILDINNVAVSAGNHGWDADAYLAGLPGKAIGEYHLAGHRRLETASGTLRLDSHDQPVAPEVWTLFAAALRRFGPRPVLVEWDQSIPPLAILLAEAERAEAGLAAHAQGREYADIA